MRLGCDYLSESLYLSDEYINVFSIENKPVFRRFVKAMLQGEPEEENFIFSKDYKPYPFRKNVCFINDCYNLSFSSSAIKKIYEDMASFCNTELSEQTFAVKRAVADFIGTVIEEYDFDFTFQEEVVLQDIFKMQNVRPDINSDSVLESLYEYIVFVQKYAPVGCFVILGLHQNFSPSELAPFYKELTVRKIRLLDIESTTDFKPSSSEKLTVIDEDLCEIVEKER